MDSELEGVLERLHRIEAGTAIVAPVNTIGHESCEIVKPFSVVIRAVDDSHVGSFLDANLSASGDTPEEALYNLKDIIISTFLMLEELGEAALGPGPLRQLRVLREFIHKVEPAGAQT